MNPAYFTVGPSQLHPKFNEFFAKAMAENTASTSHRGARFAQLFDDLDKNLKTLLNIPTEYSIFYAGSATEFMERIVQNCSTQKTLHFVDGSFSKKFSEISKENGRTNTEVLTRNDGTFSAEDAPTDYDPELICLTHNETSNGTMLSSSFLKSVHNKFPNSLIALDIVSSAPVCDVDFSKIDCAFLSIQKGFGLPAGLGMIFVSPRALQKAKEIEKDNKQYTGSHHSFKNFADYAAKKQTSETPNVLAMYLLNEVCLDYINYGIEKLKDETKIKAELIYKAIEKSNSLTPLTKNINTRSETIIVAETKNGSKNIVEKLAENGFVVSLGYGDKKDTQIRIGNFPSHSKEQVEKLSELLALF